MCRSLTEHSSCARAHEMLTLTATRERHETKIKSCRGYVRRLGSVQPCVRPLGAVHMTAGHNALRGSGPGQKPAFDHAMALVGCPDRRIDQHCITCCSPSQSS